MSYGLTANEWIDGPAGDAAAVTGEALPTGATVSEAGLTVLPADAPAQVRRSSLVPVAFAVPVLLSAVAFLSGGTNMAAWLSNVTFVVLTGLCLAGLAVELVKFGTRQGIGAILIYGGILVWFCHDFLSNWFLHDYHQYEPAFPAVTAAVVARVLFFHCLFIEVMLIAFRFPVLRFVDRLVVAVPEPADRQYYLWVTLFTLVAGGSAFLFTSDPLPVSLAKACLWFIPGVGDVHFTVSRSGNMNYNLGGYVAQIIQFGQVGGLLGAAYALLVARSVVGKAFGWGAWLFWTSYTFTSIRRGDIAFMAMPVLILLFLKFHAQADPTRRARNLRWLLGTVAVAVLTWGFVQWTTARRYNRSTVDLFRAAGNTMFSEGLNAWVVIPDQVGFAYDSWPGETVLRPLPNVLWWFLIDPVPRALWHEKPTEQFAWWYSAMISKDKRGLTTGGLTGTTVSGGAVGQWYFRYGPAGVVEGAVLYGWLFGVTERALRRARGEPLKVLFALGFATFMFRSYRDLWWHNLYPLMIAGAILAVVIRLFIGAKPEPRATAADLVAVPA